MKIGCTWIKRTTKYVCTCIYMYTHVDIYQKYAACWSCKVMIALKSARHNPTIVGNPWFLQSLNIWNKQDRTLSVAKKWYLWQSIPICWPVTVLKKPRTFPPGPGGTPATAASEWLKISMYLPPIDCRSFCRLQGRVEKTRMDKLNHLFWGQEKSVWLDGWDGSIPTLKHFCIPTSPC